MDERQQRQLPGLTLDGEDGPAKRLSAAAVDHQVAAIMAQIQAGGTPQAGGDRQPTAMAGGFSGPWAVEAAGPSPATPATPATGGLGVRVSSSRPGLKKVRVAVFIGAGLLAGSAAAMVARQIVHFTRGEVEIAEPAAAPAAERSRPQSRPAPPRIEPVLPAPVADPMQAIAAPAQRRTSTHAPDLMAKANRLRGMGRFRAAERAYLAVIAADSTASSAHVAAVAAAAIRLEHLQDVSGAAALYRRALKIQPAGPLVAESYEGLARVHRKRGDRSSEVRALRALLASGQPGPARARALARLRALDGREVQDVSQDPSQGATDSVTTTP